jgi:hypothetical protein
MRAIQADASQKNGWERPRDDQGERRGKRREKEGTEQRPDERGDEVKGGKRTRQSSSVKQIGLPAKLN